ncbi:hypothetical protein BDV96DRAFT_642992 [Lophiotrema nucula]|uniref:SnoaL-like domain-containing protein n=1 Tax=Lophiotrema nucula TaxID=690887 RepID=A0A6A5ZKP1_9PLEO|nr:hypothetical protein BDV96DRAFT_642992 [Lophiotrema nucula]
MPATADVQAAIIDAFIQGWRGWTPEGMLAPCSSDCTQLALPLSDGRPLKSRPDMEMLFPILMRELSNFDLNVHNIVHDPEHSKAALYATAKADTPFGPYNNEHALFLWFDESGNINKMEEMFDSAFMATFQPAFRDYLVSKQQKAT